MQEDSERRTEKGEQSRGKRAGAECGADGCSRACGGDEGKGALNETDA